MATRTRTTAAVQAESNCPECDGATTAHDTEVVCQECGLVVAEHRVDHGPEWRYYDSDSDPRRAAPGNPNRADGGMGSVRDTRHGDFADGRQDNLHERVTAGTKRDRNRDYATGEIRRIGVAVGLPTPAIERGQYIFRRSHDATGLEGRDLDRLAAACLYAACREQQLGRTADDIAACARCDNRAVRTRLWWVADVAGLEVPPPSTRARIRVVAGRLGLTHDECRDALALFDHAVTDSSGDSPSTLAAFAIYEVTNHTQSEVGDAAGVVPPSIRKQRDDHLPLSSV